MGYRISISQLGTVSIKCENCSTNMEQWVFWDKRFHAWYSMAIQGSPILFALHIVLLRVNVVTMYHYGQTAIAATPTIHYCHHFPFFFILIQGYYIIIIVTYYHTSLVASVVSYYNSDDNAAPLLYYILLLLPAPINKQQQRAEPYNNN